MEEGILRSLTLACLFHLRLTKNITEKLFTIGHEKILIVTVIIYKLARKKKN